MGHHDDALPPFQLPENTSLEGLLGMIICWYWDDDLLVNDATYGVSLIPDMLSGANHYFEPHEWALFVDALNAYGPLPPELEQVRHKAATGQANCGRAT